LDFGGTLSRAWTIIWENKFLILLGVIVALGSGGRGTGGAGGRGGSSGGGESSLDSPWWDPPSLPTQVGFPEAVIILAVLGIISFALLVALLLWIAATIARGGLIAGVSTIEDGQSSSFGRAWMLGWSRGWRLVGIGLAPAVPGLLLFLVGLAAAGLYAGLTGIVGERLSLPVAVSLGVPFVLVACILVPAALVLSLLRTFANRACMLEDMGVIASYQRGLNVLVQNIGPALILFLLQIAISAVLAVVLFLPGLVMVVCCILWPLLLAVKGTITGYFSTVWTLAWREWTALADSQSGRDEALSPL